MPISSAISPTFRASVVGIQNTYKNLQTAVSLLPQRIAVVGQGSTSASYSTDKRRVLSAFEAGQLYGFGSPLHLAVSQLLPPLGGGVGDIPVTVYPLEDAGSGVAAAGSIAMSGVQAEQKVYTVKVSEIKSEQIVVPALADVSQTIALFISKINAVSEMPVIASDGTTQVDLTAKWKGESGNDLFIEISGEESGITFTVNQPVGGLVNPDVDDALALVGNDWETLFLNCLNISDTDTLDKYNTFGESRWGPIKPKVCLFFSGQTESSVNLAVTIPQSRTTDRINAQLVAPGSKNLPFVVAAGELEKIAVKANENPAVDYIASKVPSLVPGPDAEQWTPVERDFAVKSGSSTIEVEDSQIELSDTVTFYAPEGDPLPAYSYVSDIIKIMNVDYVLRQKFESDEWRGKALIPSFQATTNKDARSPAAFTAAAASLLDALGLAAIISDPEAAKKTIRSGISETNPKRTDISLTYQVSSFAGIISITAFWGFYFGSV